MKKLRGAVVGVGYLGTFHAQKYKANPSIELVGVCDAHKPQAEKVGTDLSVQPFSNPKDLIGKVDLVTIASTTQTHFEIAEMFLSNGVHVNVEKPMTATVEQGEKLVALAKKNNLKLAVGQIERFNPTFNSLKSQLKNAKLIQLERLAQFKWRGADVSVLFDLGIHDVDLMLSLGLGDVKNIDVVGSKVVSQTYDFVESHIEFANGTRVQISSSRVSPGPVRQLRAYGNDFSIRADLGTGEVEVLTPSSDKENPMTLVKSQVPKVDALQLETNSFIDAVIANTAVAISGEDGLLALKFVERLQSAIKNG